MKKFKVNLTEVYKKTVYVEAESEEEIVNLIEEGEDARFFAFENYDDFESDFNIEEE